MIIQPLPYPGLNLDSTAMSANGATIPFTAAATYPAAFYDSTGDRTWISWEGFDTERVVYVQTYDHANGRWEKRYEISRDTLTDDSHGTPALCMDHEGYVHCFFGSHNSPCKYAVTTSARDPSGWAAGGDIGSVVTYPHPAMVGSTMYLFFRSNTTRYWTRYKTTALSGGMAVWGSPQNVADFGASNRFYQDQCQVVGTDIHFGATQSNSADSTRGDVFHFVYDTTDDSVRNTSGAVSTATGSQPVSLATANASYRVVNQGGVNGGGMAFCVTPNGDMHFAYINDSTNPLDVYYTTNTGSGWSTPTVITTAVGQTATASAGKVAMGLVPRSDSSIELWYTDDDAGDFTRGGDMMRLVRSAAGSWGSEQTILEAGAQPLDQPMVVRDADDKILVFFTEIADGDTDADAGGLQIYAYGDNGFAPGTAPQFISGPTITQPDGFYGTGDTLTASNLHSGTSETYQWKRDGVAISGATSATYVLTVTDEGTDITVTVSATNHVGTTAATSGAVSAVAPSYATEDRTLSDASDRTLSDTSTRTISNRTA